MLQNRVAVVTGGSRGIGRAISVALADAGADVAIFYAGNRDAASETVKMIEEKGRKALMLQVDVADEQQVDAGFKEVLSTFDRIDILVNNAGITRDNILMRIKEKDWDDVINTNLKGVFLCTRAVSRSMMKQRSGRIINISSVVGVMGNVGQANYVAAKAGVIGLTKTAARELASRGITVNAVAPGFIQTDMTAALDQSVVEKGLANVPLGKLGMPEDVAEVVKFLASDGAKYITGQTIHVDGGMCMN